jgi:Na+/H+ antiporter NhaB
LPRLQEILTLLLLLLHLVIQQQIRVGAGVAIVVVDDDSATLGILLILLLLRAGRQIHRELFVLVLGRCNIEISSDLLHARAFWLGSNNHFLPVD